MKLTISILFGTDWGRLLSTVMIEIHFAAQFIVRRNFIRSNGCIHMHFYARQKHIVRIYSRHG